MEEISSNYKIDVVDLRQIAIFQKHPEVILKILAPIEYQIIKVLYHEVSGLSARDIQKKIIWNMLKKIWDSAKNKIEEQKKIYEGLNKYLKVKYDEKISDLDFLMKNVKRMSITEQIKFIRETSDKYGVDVPAHTTVIRHLEDSLYPQGFVGRKHYPDKKRISYIYFLNPKLYSLIKEIETKWNESNKSDPTVSTWNNFFSYNESNQLFL